MKLEKKQIILACTLIVLIIVLVYRILNPFKQQEVNILTYGPDTGSEPRKDRTVNVRLSEEKSGKTGFEKAVDRYFTDNKHNGETHKNLFIVGTKSAIIKSAPPLKKPEQKEVQSQADLQKDLVQEARANLIQYQFYGSYEVGGTRAVFLGKNKMMLVARAVIELMVNILSIRLIPMK